MARFAFFLKRFQKLRLRSRSSPGLQCKCWRERWEKASYSALPRAPRFPIIVISPRAAGARNRNLAHCLLRISRLFERAQDFLRQSLFGPLGSGKILPGPFRIIVIEGSFFPATHSRSDPLECVGACRGSLQSGLLKASGPSLCRGGPHHDFSFEAGSIRGDRRS